jgi:uncharacterized protein (TIGR02646 family)
MIKLDLPPKPTELTEELQKRLTQEFKDTEKSVWNIDWLKKAVLAKSYNKCCYSEIRLDEESKYMEVEHFHPKKHYSDKVMLWENLLPSCKKCNATKGNHDTKKEPIINPFVDNPKEYLYFENYRYYSLNNNQLGRTTIDVLDLNDRNHFVNPRFKIGNEICETIEEIYYNSENLNNTKKIDKYIRKIKNLLSKGSRKEEYSALVSTIILLDTNYQNIERQLRENNLWDNEFEDMKQELEYCALIK